MIGLSATDTFSTLAKRGLFIDLTSDSLVNNIQPAYVDMLKKQTGLTALNGIPYSTNANGIIYNNRRGKG